MRTELSAEQMSATVTMTSQGREWLLRRLEELRDVELPRLRWYIETQDHDDLLQQEYERARAEMVRLDSVLRHAVVLREPATAENVQLGDELELRTDSETMDRFRIVHPIEAPMDDERISSHAPLARATLGRRAGDVVQVFAPDGLREFRLVGWAAESSPRRMLLEPA
jgi:transcription elongation factor GreA